MKTFRVKNKHGREVDVSEEIAADAKRRGLEVLGEVVVKKKKIIKSLKKNKHTGVVEEVEREVDDMETAELVQSTPTDPFRQGKRQRSFLKGNSQERMSPREFGARYGRR